MMEVLQLSLNDVLGYKVVVHVHGYRSPSNMLGQSRYTRLRLTLDKVVNGNKSLVRPLLDTVMRLGPQELKN